MGSKILLLLLRHGLTVIATLLAGSGYLDSDNSEKFVGAILFLVSIGLSIYTRFTEEKAVEVALDLPQGSSVAELNEALKK